uniref:Ig-like domain-containing protein n=1 Tax=Oncorhynchus kisutch TaxID=8019 RepID=A0A8C7MIV4_ONCKI
MLAGIFIIVFPSAGMVCGDSVTPDKEEYTPTEGSSVSLRCTYETSSNVIYLYWYQQYYNQAPQYLQYKYARVNTVDHIPNNLYESTTSKTSTTLKIKLWQTRLSTTISSAEVIDSALYYCALRHKVTGKPETCTKNIEHLITGRKLSTGSKMNIS